eukprot:8716965-Pyramimonas_sp.AAC.2
MFTVRASRSPYFPPYWPTLYIARYVSLVSASRQGQSDGGERSARHLHTVPLYHRAAVQRYFAQGAERVASGVSRAEHADSEHVDK